MSLSICFSLCFIVPCPNLYVQLNGLTFTVDPVSLLWGNLFCLDLYHSLEQFKAIYKLEDSRQKDEHLDIRLDAFWLKVGREWGFPVRSSRGISQEAVIHSPSHGSSGQLSCLY